MTRIASQKRTDLARTIRHQAAAPATRRMLRDMPAFRVVKDIPEHLQALLDRLEAMETDPHKDR
jgi:hypothetical protein